MRLSKRDIGLFAFVGVALIILLFGLDLIPSPFATGGPTQTFLPTAVTSAGNAIVRENALLGTTGWQIPEGKEASTEIQAYAGATSVLPGHTLTFYVSTQREGTPYSISIYRLGWYGGTGGRLKFYQANLVGHAQGNFDLSKHILAGCNACRVNLQTGLVEANWRASYTLTVPSDWTTGIYLAKFVDVNGMQIYTPFDVQGNSRSAYVVVTPDLTNAAYNVWGRFSLYEAPASVGVVSEAVDRGAGVKVSFDRPYATGGGASYLLSGEADAIHWLERQGYDLSYMSDIDVHENPGELLNHKAYLSIGQDEYWSKEERDAVVRARDRGVGLAFLAGNDVYWQIRLEPDSAGTPDRTVVCYKVQAVDNDYALDPLYGKDNTRVTAQWRDPVLGLPENSLVGILYSGLNPNKNFPWRVSPQAKSPLLDGTGLLPGKSYGCGIVGNEWDRVVNNAAAPAGLQVLGASPTVNGGNKPDVSNTTYYIARSGAMVFATGSTNWILALDSYRFSIDPACANQNPVVPGLQKLLANVIAALAIRHPSQQLTGINFPHALSS
jgi:hypothetical protein